MARFLQFGGIRNAVAAAINRVWRPRMQGRPDIETGHHANPELSSLLADQRQRSDKVQIPQSLIDAARRLLFSRELVKGLEEACNADHASIEDAGIKVLLQKLSDEQAAYRQYQQDVEMAVVQLLAATNLLNPHDVTGEAKVALREILEVNCEPVTPQKITRSLTEQPSDEKKHQEETDEALPRVEKDLWEIIKLFGGFAAELEDMESGEHFDQEWNTFWFEAINRGEPADVPALSHQFDIVYAERKTWLREEKRSARREFRQLWDKAKSLGVDIDKFMFAIPDSLACVDDDADNEEEMDSGYEGENENVRFGGDDLTPSESWDAKKNRLATWVGNLPHNTELSPNGYFQLADDRTMAPSSDERQNFHPEDNIIDRDIVWEKAGLIFGRQSREQPRSLEEAITLFGVDIPLTREARVPGLGMGEWLGEEEAVDDELRSLDSEVVEVRGESEL